MTTEFVLPPICPCGFDHVTCFTSRACPPLTFFIAFDERPSLNCKSGTLVQAGGVALTLEHHMGLHGKATIYSLAEGRRPIVVERSKWEKAARRGDLEAHRAGA